MLRYDKSDSDLRIVPEGKFILHSPNTQQHDNNLNPKQTMKISKINKQQKQTNTLKAHSDRRSSLAAQRPQPSRAHWKPEDSREGREMGCRESGQGDCRHTRVC